MVVIDMAWTRISDLKQAAGFGWDRDFPTPGDPITIAVQPDRNSEERYALTQTMVTPDGTGHCDRAVYDGGTSRTHASQLRPGYGKGHLAP
jgi:hypothetical protein